MIQRFHSSVARKRAATPPIGGGGLSNFNDISGCIMQCLASQLSGYSIGDTVSGVPDTSTGAGLGLVSANSPTYQIVGGKPVVRLTFGANALSIAHTFTGENTIICRGSMVSGGTKQRIFAADFNGTGSNCLLGWYGGWRDQCYWNAAVKLDFTPSDDSAPHTYALRQTTATLPEFWGDGVMLAQVGFGISAPNGFGVNLVEPSDCYFNGLVFYNRRLDDTELAAAMALMDTF